MHHQPLQVAALTQWPVVFGIIRRAERQPLQTPKVGQVRSQRIQVQIYGSVVQFYVSELQDIIQLRGETGVKRLEILQ
jgi:hypothetical protein